MGVPRAVARLLFDETRQRPFRGRLLQLGRSTVYVTARELAELARLHGLDVGELEVQVSHDPRLARQGCIDDQTLFRRLGFERVESCDIADWEGADHIVDLNQPVPASLHEAFDAVFETGTIIQIYDLAQVFRNVMSMVRPGGRVLHAGVPSSNHVDLGFTMFSPTLLHDLYSANGWRIETSYVCAYRPFWFRGRLLGPPWKIYRYDPERFARLSYGGWGSSQLALFFVATRLPESRTDVVPQLGQYRRTWQAFAGGASEAAGAEAAAAVSPAEGWLDRLPGALPLYFALKPWKQRFDRFRARRRLECVARY
jgi:hypothetical protein